MAYAFDVVADPELVFSLGSGADSVRRQLFFPVSDNYFSRSTTITPEAARSAAGRGRRPPADWAR